MQNIMHRNQPNKRQTNQALSFVLAQLTATFILSALLLAFDLTAAYSAFIGGMIASLATGWFALKVFRQHAKVSAEAVLATFYVGEIYKFLFTGAMFVLAFVLIKPINVIALLVTYFLIHMTPAVVTVFTRDESHQQRDKES